MADGKPGRKAWQPTKSERQTVEMLVAAGYTQDQVCRVLDVSIATLHKHCKKELEAGKDKITAFVIGQLFKAIKEGDKASIFFYLKTKAGWRETDREDEKREPVTVNLNLTTDAKP